MQGNETCFENVSLPLEIAEEPIFRRKEIIESALKAVGLEDKIKTPARDLSGGQKQRLAIARAIANSPEIIFADEPTGNLDSITSAKIEKMLFEYNKNSQATLLIVTHDEELAEKCDIRIRIKDGKVEQIEGVRNA